MAKSKDNYKLNFVGNNAIEVTGSMTLLTIKDTQILIDCGMTQTNSIQKDFEKNSRLPKEIKPNSLSYVAISHLHIDHLGLTPLLVKNGYTGTIFIPKGSKEIAKKMLLDSAYIIDRNAMMLGKTAYYDEQDVWTTLRQMEELDFNHIYTITEDFSVELLHAGHILSSAQILFHIKQSDGHIKRVLFTGDIGNIKNKPVWCEEFQPCAHAHVVVGECTYNSPDRTKKSHTRDKDREKMKTVIDSVMEVGGKVLIPSFSYSRTQVILEELYQLYHKTKFPYNIIIDSPLSVQLTTLYHELLDGEKKEYLGKILKWENLILSSEHKVHERLVNLGKPMVIIASSGFLDFGRSNSWIKNILPKKSSHVLFVGYSSPTSIAGKIKSGEQKTIKIGKENFKNNCNITSLNSFSSHMQYDDLIEYYKSIGAESIYLVHGEFKGKVDFANVLTDELRKDNQTTKVVAVNKGTTCSF